jgi:uncharacterized protein (TIGR02265 family)
MVSTSVERLVFRSTVSSMLKVLGNPIAPEHVVALQQAGIDPTRPLLVAYPLESFQKLLALAGKVRFPKLGPEERDYALGELFVVNFATSLIGGAVVAMARVLGPRRSTQRLTRSFRSVNNYSEAEAKELSANEMEVRCEPVLRPDYYLGVLQTAGRMSHGESYQVELSSYENERAVFRVRW